MMAEICCEVVSEAEIAVVAMAGVRCKKISRAARRRRVEIRQFKYIAGVDMLVQDPDIGQKRPRMNLAAPIIALPDSSKDIFSGRLESPGNFNAGAGNEGFSSSCRLNCGEDIAGVVPAVLTEPEVAILGECPTYGMMSVCGRRRDMEDTVSVCPDFLQRNGQIPARYHFFAVFDGHGCSHVAVSCKERMHEMVAEELDRPEKSPRMSLEWKSLMERSFSRMDEAAAAWRGGPDIPACRCEFQTPKCDHVGSAAIVAIISDDRLVIANCGDSRAVLCRNGAPILLSSDHKPDRPDELKRIQDAGGRVIYWDGARVLGVLAMSRAIGEMHYYAVLLPSLENAFLCGVLTPLDMVSAGDNYLKPFVISEPEVTVTDRGEGEDFLILASDGLWDVVTNETACEIVGMCLRGSQSSEDDAYADRPGSIKACNDAAMLLTKLALARQSADNISVVVVDLMMR